LTTVYRNRNLQLVFGNTLMVVLGVSSIMPVIPQLANEFSVPQSSIGLLITVFTLPGIILAPVAGVLADRIGRRMILVPSLIIFGLFGGLCGLATDFHSLLALRFIQGVGSAAMGVMSLTIIGDLFTGTERTEAMGLNAAVLSIGTAAYPALGGALALFGWQFPFLLHLIAIPLAFMVHKGMDNPEPSESPGLRSYLNSAFQQMARREVSTIYLITLITFVLLYGPFITFFPILMAGTHGADPLQIGLVVSSASLLTALAASQLGRLARIFRETKLILFSFLLYAVSFLIMPFIPGIWQLIVPALIFGLAQGLNIPNLASLLSGYATSENRAAVMAMNGMLLRIGQTIGPLLMGAVFAGLGIEWVFYSGSLLALVTIMAALRLHRSPVNATPGIASQGDSRKR
jgi:MFS family permease